MCDKLTQRGGEQNRAVSPVIGVILMVAITVILAAVIGAFVLEIGDQQETAPKTSFDIEESTQYYTFYSQEANLTKVDMSHAGGDVVEASQTEVKVNGNTSTWNIEATDDRTHALGIPLAGGYTYDFTAERVKECPPGDVCDFKSGNTWTVVAYGLSVEQMLGCCNNQVDGWRVTFQDGSPDYNHPAVCCNKPSVTPDFMPLIQGDKITIVWTASSGGKTQALQKYSVQQTSPDLVGDPQAPT